MKKPDLCKKAYGWDVKGDVSNPLSGPLNIEDTSTPLSQHKTPLNMVNMLTDVEAKREWPGLGVHMHRFPSRGKI